MEDIQEWASAFADKNDGRALDTILQSVYDTLEAVDTAQAVTTETLETSTFDRFKSASLASAGLVIKAGGGVLVKTGAAWHGLAGGTLITVASGVDMDALVGTVAHDAYNVYAFTVDAASALTTTMGTAGATLAAVVLPTIPADDCLIGLITIHPTGTGDFVGGDTPLDCGTVVPEAAYLNSQGAIAFAQP